MHTKAKPLSRSLGDQEPFPLTLEKHYLCNNKYLRATNNLCLGYIESLVVSALCRSFPISK
jgi:hypothetical protein